MESNKLVKRDVLRQTCLDLGNHQKIQKVLRPHFENRKVKNCVQNLFLNLRA